MNGGWLLSKTVVLIYACPDVKQKRNSSKSDLQTLKVEQKRNSSKSDLKTSKVESQHQRLMHPKMSILFPTYINNNNKFELDSLLTIVTILRK